MEKKKKVGLCTVLRHTQVLTWSEMPSESIEEIAVVAGISGMGCSAAEVMMGMERWEW